MTSHAWSIPSTVQGPRRLCRYVPLQGNGNDNDNDDDDRNAASPWIMIRKNYESCGVANNNNKDHGYSISLGDFEEIMEHSLDDRIQPLHYINRDDFVWLNCCRPLYPIESVLGLEEESDTPSSQRTILIDTYKLLVDDKNNAAIDHNQMHETWISRCSCPSNTISPMVHGRMDDSTKLKGGRQTSSNEEDSVATALQWVDCRSLDAADFDFSSQATCAHFLRCLLDARHDASPWVVVATDTAAAVRDDDESDKDIVILTVKREALPEKLIEFRVSDACPSWFLHAVGHVKDVNAKRMPWLQPLNPDDTNNENCSITDNVRASGRDAARSNDNGDNYNDQAAILFYRRLPPRAGLFDRHPVSQEPVKMPGCLWESYSVVKEEGEAPEIRYRVVGPPILNPLVEYPTLLEPLLHHDMIHLLRKEALAIAHWTAWPEQQHYKATSETGEAPWNVFPLCHTFPAHDLTKRQWVPMTCAVVPQTVSALQTILGDTLRTALFSRLDPESVLEAHTGWEDLANHVLRVHIPLVVPPGNLCGVWVDGCVQLHQEGEGDGQALCFDDSKTHRAFNYSKAARIVLILDLARPTTLPLGTATGGHSDELDEFIGKMGVAR